jgi:naphtho-gamma-pyrone polyketide synthase
MTRPHVGAQAFIFDKMLRTANVDPLDISYIECHGTGTQTGDAVEMKSVLDVFAKTPRGSKHPLYLGSAKANVGHAESASGITSLIKVLMMMQHNEIPPHCGIKTKINRGFPTDLKARNVNIAMEPTHWPRPSDGKRTVFMNNFSAAGGNTALLMEDAPLRERSDKINDSRSCHLVAVSGKSVTSVRKNIEAMLRFIDETPDLSLPSLSYTTTARRMHHSYRVVVSGNDLSSIKESLQRVMPCESLTPISAKTPNVVFVFTGQGSMYAGMAQQLFENISSFRADIQHFDRIAQRQGFPSILPLIQDGSASLEKLGPVATQLGTMCMQMALARLWTAWGVSPSAVIGHSLGEYAALHIAGVISASDAIFLTGTRATMLVQRCSMGTHAMLAVKSSVANVTPHLAGTGCEIACINGANEVVVSGRIVEIDALSATLTPVGLKCVKLEVPFAFHSAQVEPILEEFETAAQGAVFNKPAIPFISPFFGGVVKDEKILGPSYLSHACRKTVNFLSGLEAAKTAAVINDKTLWVEIGSHPVCSGMIKSAFGQQTIAVPSLRRNSDTWKVIADSVSTLHREGIEIQWNEYHRDFEACHKVLKLPSYQWDSKNHWIQYSNNFCLTKGDSPAPLTAAPALATLSTTSVQRVIDRSIGSEKSTVLAESDLSDPLLSQVVQSHMVNGTALCPSVSPNMSPPSDENILICLVSMGRCCLDARGLPVQGVQKEYGYLRHGRV